MWKLVNRALAWAFGLGLQPIIPEHRDWDACIGEQWAKDECFIICPNTGRYVEIGGGG
jgi:hypothetical protein